MKHARWGAVAAMGAAALMITGCGSGTSSNPTGVSGTALAKQVGSAVAGASSVHLAGKVAESGKVVGMDLSMTSSGDVSGTISLGSVTILVLKTGGKVYVKGTKAFLTYAHIPAAAAASMRGKYLKMPASSARGLLSGTGWSFVGSLGKKVPKLTYLGTATVDGQSAWKVNAPGNGTVYVAAHAPHYLLRWQLGSNRLDFTEWNAATIPPPPPAKKIFKLG